MCETQLNMFMKDLLKGSFSNTTIEIVQDNAKSPALSFSQAKIAAEFAASLPPSNTCPPVHMAPKAFVCKHRSREPESPPKEEKKSSSQVAARGIAKLAAAATTDSAATRSASRTNTAARGISNIASSLSKLESYSAERISIARKHRHSLLDRRTNSERLLSNLHNGKEEDQVDRRARLTKVHSERGIGFVPTISASISDNEPAAKKPKAARIKAPAQPSGKKLSFYETLLQESAMANVSPLVSPEKKLSPKPKRSPCQAVLQRENGKRVAKRLTAHAA